MYNLPNLFRFLPKKWRTKLPKKCLSMCKHKHIKSFWATFFNYFSKNNVLKNPTLIQLRGEGPTLIFSEVGHRKIKANRWGERSPKMRNLHRCHSLQKFSKYIKTTETCRLGSNGLPPVSVAKGLNKNIKTTVSSTLMSTLTYWKNCSNWVFWLCKKIKK